MMQAVCGTILLHFNISPSNNKMMTIRLFITLILYFIFLRLSLICACVSHFSFTGVLRAIRVGRESDFGHQLTAIHDRLPHDDPRKFATHRKNSTHQ